MYIVMLRCVTLEAIVLKLSTSLGNHSYSVLLSASWFADAGSRGHSTKFYTRILRRPTSHHFIYLCDRKGTPFVFLLLTNGTPFTLPSLELCISFNYCKCTVFLI